jgi:hypothetical protein
MIDPPVPNIDELPRPGTKRRGACWFGAFVTLAVYACIKQAGSLHDSLAILGAAMAGWYATVLVHESGHAAAAALCNFRIIGASLSWLHLGFVAGRLEIRLKRRVVGGSVTALPRDGHRVRQRALAIVSAGPIASLLGAVGFTALETVTFAHGWAAAALSFAAFFSALVALSGVIDVGRVPPGYKTDAAKARMLWRDTREARRHCALLSVLGRLHAGERPRDCPPEVMRDLARLCNVSDESALAAILIAEWASDRGDEPSCTAWLDFAWATRSWASPSNTSIMSALCATNDALVLRDDSAARVRLAEYGAGDPNSPWLLLIAQAAIRLVENDIQGAMEKADAALALLPKRSGAYSAEFARIERIRREALAGAGQADQPGPAIPSTM